jgi:hypothetical protein
MKIKDYIYPTRVYKSLVLALKEKAYASRYTNILNDLEREEKLKRIGLKKDGDKLFFGVDLNPELLMYTEDSKESVELKFVSDATRKYTNFLQNEGILDSIKADYERVFNDDFYGYIVQISYSYKNYVPRKFRYDIWYFIGISTVLVGSITIALLSIL